MSYETLTGILDAIGRLADGMAGGGEVSRLVAAARAAAEANGAEWGPIVSSLDTEMASLRGMAGLEE